MTKPLSVHEVLFFVSGLFFFAALVTLISAVTFVLPILFSVSAVTVFIAALKIRRDHKND